MSKKNKSNRLVYSTEFGRTCPECEEQIEQCSCSGIDMPEGDGVVRLSLDTKGRKGKGVTLVKGVLLPSSELKKLAKELKQKCGVGGALKDFTIEIQGDHRDLLCQLLQQKGFTVKRSGG
jgi:translation initiation factor 1